MQSAYRDLPRYVISSQGRFHFRRLSVEHETTLIATVYPVVTIDVDGRFYKLFTAL